jgi:hypothetical protein
MLILNHEQFKFLYDFKPSTHYDRPGSVHGGVFQWLLPENRDHFEIPPVNTFVIPADSRRTQIINYFFYPDSANLRR